MPAEERLPELDALRGIAVGMMVLYHLLFDLAFFYAWDIPMWHMWWSAFARVTAMLFLLLVGICFAIAWERASRCVRALQRGLGNLQEGAPAGRPYRRYLRRGLFIIGGGMLVSMATWLIAPTMFVKFGILHLIGTATLLLPFFARFTYGNILLGSAISLAGMFPSSSSLHSFSSSSTLLSSLLLPLGFPPPGFASLDYYPLIPWFGVVLTGIGLGRLLYVPTRHHLLRQFARFPYPPTLLWIGQKSLWIYFVHQPLLLLLLALILRLPVASQ